MKLIWTSPALADRNDIWVYIAQDNVDVAIRLDNRFSVAAANLRDFPESGRRGATQGTRELLPHRNYRLFYTIEADMVWIVALVHVARQWPPVRLDDA